MVAQPELVCPRCRHELTDRGDGASFCRRCEHTYPEVAGILDLRLRSDRYLSLEQDRSKAERLAAQGGNGHAALVAAYWEMTPEVPAALSARYAERADDGVRRGLATLDAIDSVRPGQTLLDVGCGTGGLVVAAAQRGLQTTGLDIALRWLVVARELAAETGVDVRFVAADGTTPPFQSSTYDRVICLETVEHSHDQRGLVQACLLAARPGGRVDIVVTNRFSLAPEPVAGLWGVGYLPRMLQPAYVRRRRGTRYQFFRAVSSRELRSLVGPREDVRVGPGPLPVPMPNASMQRLGAQALYDKARRREPGRRMLTPVAPYLEITGQVAVR
jgi:2-polyprenyl-3-methyl-5-hydroxy-6-metoxy-1,4-benzoquinol methylase